MRLTVETGPLAGTVISLDRNQPTVLGSGADCALRIQEAGVAAQQAVVKALKDQGFGIKALAPGLRVNGAHVEATPLADGDIIELGTTRIAFGQVQKRGLPQITGYRVIDELGRGGMGYVYRAEQTSLHREVALKVLNRELTKDPAFVAKFVAEARAAAKLQHPNVVQVFDVDNDGETYFYAMELMHDGSLEDWLKQQGAMPVDRALRVVADAAAGLAYAESLGIVHRDIKPDNLMLDHHGAVKIADLGLASTVEETEEKAIGTPHFMAPEQVLRKEIDHRTDLYALGCTFYRLVTGKTPFRGQSVKDILRAQVKDEAEPAHKANTNVSAEVGGIIQRLMAKDPAQRYQTANDLLEDLGALLQPPAKKGLWIGLAAAAVVIAGGAVYWGVNKPKGVETVTEYINNPEAARLAKENAQLKKDAREAQATIALLAARVSGASGHELAEALDRVAAEFADAKASIEARQRATQVRQELDDRARTLEQQRARLTDHLAAVQRASASARDAGDFAAALKALDLAPTADLRADAELQQQLSGLREQVMKAARDRLAVLVAAVTNAQASREEATITAASEALTTATSSTSRWPVAMKDELAKAQAHVELARQATIQLANARGEAVWEQYHALFAAGQGPRAALELHDYAAAAAAITQFATAAGATAAARMATDFAAAATHAGVFAAEFDRAMAAGAVQLPGITVLQVVRWDRVSNQMAAFDPAKKPAKEQLIAVANVTLEQWSAMCDQVSSAPTGARECFLGFVTLTIHSHAARGFLARLRASDDNSGAGAAAYPLNAATFETLQRRLPEQDTAAWSKGIRVELQAGQRLAAGLRALSERRNLAAAGHLEKLLAEHPHSLVVAVLP